MGISSVASTLYSPYRIFQNLCLKYNRQLIHTWDYLRAHIVPKLLAVLLVRLSIVNFYLETLLLPFLANPYILSNKEKSAVWMEWFSTFCAMSSFAAFISVLFYIKPT